MVEYLTSASIAVGIALPLAAVVIAFVLPRLTREYKAGPHLHWGSKAYSAGRYREAMGQFDKAVAIAPANPVGYHARGFVRWRTGDLSAAADDFDEAIRLAPGEAAARCSRGVLRSQVGDSAGARADYEEALRLDPEAIYARNNLAWLLATCPDASFRDGPRAVTLATAACDRTGWREADCLGTLAAAHAECGDFAEAVRLVGRALDLVPEGENAKIRRAMLESFERGEPHRDRRTPEEFRSS